MFSKSKIRIALILFAIIVTILAVISNPFISLPILGGVITQGILGGFSGKVGPVVGGKWKDVSYMRSYVIPANPNTIAQQAVRAKFAKMIDLGKKLLSTLLQTYWDPFESSMSGFNAWIKSNYSTLDGSNDLVATSIMAKGSLETLHSNASTYNTATGEVEATYDPTISGNGLTTDSVGLVAYDKNAEVFFSNFSSLTRNGATATVTIPTGLTAANIITYVFAFRGTGAQFVVSDSIGDVCAAA